MIMGYYFLVFSSVLWITIYYKNFGLAAPPMTQDVHNSRKSEKGAGSMAPAAKRCGVMGELRRKMGTTCIHACPLRLKWDA